MSALYEAGALARMLEAANASGSTDRKLEEATHDLEAANQPELVRQLDKVRELHRLYAARLVNVLRALEGTPR